MVIGVTGKYCAGKNVVTGILRDKGFEVIDVDSLGHEALENKKDDIASRFGSEVLDADKRIDRKALGSRVFGDRKELDALEGIVHPWMKERVRREISSAGNDRNWVVNAALLFYMDLHPLCDAVIWVKSSLPRRLARALKRDRLSLGEVLKRFYSQRKLSAQSSENDVDIYYIDNSRDFDNVLRGVDRVVARLK